MFCKSCGSSLHEGDKICGVCGAPVSTRRAPEPVRPVAPAGVPELVTSVVTPTGTTVSATPAPTTESAPEEEQAVTGKFDFNWSNDGFDVQKGAWNDPIDFKWDTVEPPQPFSPQAGEIAAAAKQKEDDEAILRRAKEASSIFEDDTFHLRNDDKEEAELLFSKKNEAFQEFLDEEVEKSQTGQKEIDEDLNRISEVMTTPTPTPQNLVSGEDALKTAEERIADFLRKADLEMLEAIEQQVNEKRESISQEQQPPETTESIPDHASFDYTPGSESDPAPVSYVYTPEPTPAPTPTLSEISDLPEFVGREDPEQTLNDLFNDRSYGYLSELFTEESSEPEPDETTVFYREEKPEIQPETPLGTEKAEEIEEVREQFERKNEPGIDEAETLEELLAAFSPSEQKAAAEPKPVIAPKPVIIPEPVIVPEPTAPPTSISVPAAEEKSVSIKLPDEPKETPAIFDSAFASPFAETTEASVAIATPTPTTIPSSETLDTADAAVSIFGTEFASPFTDIATPTPELESTPEPEPEPKPKPEPTPELESTLEPDPQPELESTPDPEPTSEPEPEPKPEAKRSPVQIAPTTISKEVSVAAALDEIDALDALDAHDALETLHTKDALTPENPPEKTASPAPSTEDVFDTLQEMNETPASTSAPDDTKTHMPDLVNKPVVFPFDDEGEKDDKKDKKKDKKESKKAVSPAAQDKPAPDDKPTEAKEKNNKSIILINILVVLVILVFVCFAFLKFAPDSGISELLRTGFQKITGGVTAEQYANKKVEPETTADGQLFVAPVDDGRTLVSSQLSNNYNVDKIKYDRKAAYAEGKNYAIDGASASVPITNNYWTDRGEGTLLIDESAVGAVIRYNSKLITFINSGDTSIFDEILPGSAEEQNLTEYAQKTNKLAIKKLGIGEVRQKDQFIFVWTKENVKETIDGKEVESTKEKLYQIATVTGVMLICDVKEIS